MVVDPLERRQTCHCRGPGLDQVQVMRNTPNMVGLHRHIFSIKTSLLIDELVSPDLIACTEAPHTCTSRSDNPCTVSSQDEREFRAAAGPPAFTNICVPHADSCGIQHN